jgi:hypothetical protein
MAVQYAFGKIVTQGLDLNVDAADPTSYPGSGTSWTSVVNRSITGSLVSCSYSSDFKGGIVLSNQSSSIQFSGSVANFGSGSFSVDITVRPFQIQGIHWLFSKNSGSFPNWGAYISGSGGSGKAFLVCNISSTVSASVSSSGTLTTGSTYVSSFRFSPFLTGSYGAPVAGTFMTFNNGATPGGLIQSNASGSLATTASLFVGNTNTQNLAFSGSIYNIRIYQGPSNFSQIGLNYSTQCTRFGLPQQSPATRFIRTLAVGPGGGAGIYQFNGGGGGGAVVEAYTTINTGRNRVVVGAGAEAGRTALNGSDTYLNRTSSFSDIVAIGGGNGATRGSSFDCTFGGSGSSGGGGNPSGQAALYNGIYYGFNGGSGITGGGGGTGGPGTGSLPGPGLGSDISGILTYYGGGGAGYSTTPIAGGIGGGGGNTAYRFILGLPTQSGGFNLGMTGSANTGGGGGAAGPDGRNNLSTAAGGSGIVIMRYQGAPQALGGIITTVGGDTVHTFTASADFILL